MGYSLLSVSVSSRLDFVTFLIAQPFFNDWHEIIESVLSHIFHTYVHGRSLAGQNLFPTLMAFWKVVVAAASRYHRR